MWRLLDFDTSVVVLVITLAVVERVGGLGGHPALDDGKVAVFEAGQHLRLAISGDELPETSNDPVHLRLRLSPSLGVVAGLVEGPTKNHTARTVPVPAFVARLLATETAGRDGDALVFESRRGGYLTLKEAGYHFAKATVTAGCGRVRLHDLRHTCASLAISAGANVKVVQKLLGHKTAVLTLDRYGHLFPDDLDAVADAFDAAAESTAYQLRTGQHLRVARANDK
jgi:integrase